MGAIVFPTHVGVFLTAYSMAAIHGSLPHACGGEVVRRFKAREKGCSSMLRGGLCCFVVSGGGASLFFAFLLPGDGGAGEGGGVSVSHHPPE